MTKVKMHGLARLRLAYFFFFPSTTIRIRIRPNTAVNCSVIGRILKTHIRYSLSWYQCNRLLGKSHLRNDLLCLEWAL